MEPQLNAFQFIDEALTRFDSKYGGPLTRFKSEHGDKTIACDIATTAFRKYVISEIDGEVRRVEEWMDLSRKAGRAAEKAGAYYFLDTLKKVANVLHCGPSGGKPGGASAEQLGLCRKVAKVLVEKYGADPAWVDCLAD